MPSVQLVSAAGSVGRRNRNPRNNFAVAGRPWSITPFFVAPVLAGETMKSLLYQGTTRIEGVASNQSGWWHEVYFFYVKHRDMKEREKITDIHVLNKTDPSLRSFFDRQFFHADGVSWARMAYTRVVEEYFRDEGEAWDVSVDDLGYARAKLNRDNWLDSAVKPAPVEEEQDLLPGDKVEESMHENYGVPVGFETHYDTWMQMRRARLVEVDFEDYLKAHGIRVPKDETNPHRPELLRYVQDWQTPRPWQVGQTGQTTASVQWVQQERADKDRFFSEPGVIIGVQVTRPKFMYRNIKGSALGLLDDAFAWLPAVLRDNPETSLKVIEGTELSRMFGSSVEENAPAGVWFDVRDLFLYGEDFTNLGLEGFPSLESVSLAVGLPDASFNRRYATDDDLLGLFAPVVPLIPGSGDEVSYGDPNYVEEVLPLIGPSWGNRCTISEGVVSLTISSRIADTSGYGGQGGIPSIGSGGPHVPEPE